MYTTITKFGSNINIFRKKVYIYCDFNNNLIFRKLIIHSLNRITPHKFWLICILIFPGNSGQFDA